MLPNNEVEVDPAKLDRIDALPRGLNADDLEFLEFPTSIWEAISATVKAERDVARVVRTAPWAPPFQCAHGRVTHQC